MVNTTCVKVLEINLKVCTSVTSQLFFGLKFSVVVLRRQNCKNCEHVHVKDLIVCSQYHTSCFKQWDLNHSPPFKHSNVFKYHQKLQLPSAQLFLMKLLLLSIVQIILNLSFVLECLPSLKQMVFPLMDTSTSYSACFFVLFCFFFSSF